jgi:hypothetical protein
MEGVDGRRSRSRNWRPSLRLPARAASTTRVFPMKRVHSLLACVALCLPALAHDQLLDFGSVCASPPCAIGSLYAPCPPTSFATPASGWPTEA